MALTPILTGEAEVALRHANLAQCVEVTEGNPKETLVHFQEVLLAREPEECPERLVLGVSLHSPGSRLGTVE